MDRVTVKAISTKDAAEAQKLKESATLSDKLTDELLASDLLVVATPTCNFGIPSSRKAWVDLVPELRQILSLDPVPESSGISLAWRLIISNATHIIDNFF